MKNETIKTIGRLAYVKLFDWPDFPRAKSYVDIDDEDYRQLFWRFYWRQS